MSEGERRRVLILNENDSAPRDRRVWQVSLSLTRAGFDVVIVCPTTETETEPYVRLDGIDIHRYPSSFAAGGALGYAREYGAALWHIWRLVHRLSRRRPFDVVHACNPPDLLVLPALPLKRRGARVVFDHHDLVPELYLSRFRRGRDPLYWLVRALERLTFAVADVTIATNDSYRRVALGRGSKEPKDVFVVRNDPDLSRFRPGSPDSTLRRGRDRLLAYVGVMGPQDGVDYALRALAQLKRRRTDWHAIFIGDGDVLPEMRALARELSLDEHVEFAGWQGDEEIVRVLSTADVCLAPDPPSPLNDVSTMVKIAEYMAMSRPIVSFDLAESRVSAGGAAVYAAGGDESRFAALVDELLSDPERRSRMGAEGRARAEQLSWDRSEAALLAAYDRALAGYPAATSAAPRASSTTSS
jgi:glycosyltransferase involved in cell wall biosynthesis